MIKFTLELNEPTSEIDSFSQGHIIIKKNNTIYSSKNLDINKSMMIFISIVELLDGIRIFLKDENKKSYCFVGVDSSFQLFLIKNLKKNELILKDSENIEISRLNENDFVNSIWNGIKTFISKYQRFLDEEEIIIDDLKNSIEEFRKQFNLT